MVKALVLGGGGAKGMAHIGVLRAFHEAGVEFDMVVGCSIGAIIGGFYAAGYSVPLIERIGREIAAAPTREFLAPSFTPVEILNSEKFENFLRRYVGDLKIEELPIRYVANAYDILTHREVIVSSGSLMAAMRVSASLPGIFEAITFRSVGMTLVDGGVVDPVPVRVARKLGADFVVAVNLLERFPKGEVEAKLPYFRRKKGIISGISRLLSIRRKNALRVIAESFTAYQGALVEYLLEANPPDVLIEPYTGDVGLLDFDLKNYENLRERGYTVAVKVLKERNF